MIEADDIASVIVPLTITGSMITSITANGVQLPEDPKPAYSAATTYGIGDQVHSPVTHRVYESLKVSNINHDPTSPVNQFTATGAPTWWVDIGPTNRWAAFDGLISTPTSGASPLVLVIKPGAFNGLSLFGLDADSISIVIRDAPGGNIIYSSSGPLEGSMPADYYEYFFAPFKPLTQYQLTGLQPYNQAELTITLTKATGTAKVGMLTVGDVKPLGVPERNTRVTPRTYSYIAEDSYGNTIIRHRPSATGLSLQIKVPLENADDVIQTIQDLLDVPVAVLGSKAQFHTKLSTFGLISGDMDYSTFPERTLNLSVKGFI